MNIEIIEDDVFGFTDKYFAKTFEPIESSYEFIDMHQLIEPKQNYFFNIKYLNTTMQNFSNMDFAFASKTLKKIAQDIKGLQKLYQSSHDALNNLEEIFETKFLQKVPLFMDMKAEIIAIKKEPLLSNDDKETLQIIKKHYTKIKPIYFEIFKDDFLEQSHKILSSLKNILNSKSYYFDKLLWEDANKSLTVTRVLKSIHKENPIDSKLYIKYRLDIDLPYTNEYKYLQQCLKVYK